MSDTDVYDTTADGHAPFSVFVSYARADDEVPQGAESGYLQSRWCRFELANFAAKAAARGRRHVIFPVEIERTERTLWPDCLKLLPPIQFWEQQKTSSATSLAGYPVPKPDGDSLYWTRVNNLAHAIAERFREGEKPGAADQARKTAVLLAEVTDDFDGERNDIKASLKQRDDVVILPASPYPRDSESDFLARVRSDVKAAQLFVQLLGPHAGKKAAGSQQSFVWLQAREAMRQELRLMQWRPPSLALHKVPDSVYRDLLNGEHVISNEFEEFRASVLKAAGRLQEERSKPVQGGARISPAAPDKFDGSAQGLSLYLQATEEDRSHADRVAEDLESAGATVWLSPDPAPDQTFLQSLSAQEEALRLCNGVLLIYGNSKPTTVLAAFQYASRVFGVQSPGIWSAVLNLPPAEKSRLPIRSKSLLTIECLAGFELVKLGGFFDGLRRAASAHA